jgi:serine/threonine-protein kinase
MGEVFLALDPALGRQVAIKVLNADLLGNEAMRARFLAEARTVAALNHPSIVTLYEAGFTEEAIPGFSSGTPYFVMGRRRALAAGAAPAEAARRPRSRVFRAGRRQPRAAHEAARAP